jgi:hypothetical protein
MGGGGGGGDTYAGELMAQGGGVHTAACNRSGVAYHQDQSPFSVLFHPPPLSSTMQNMRYRPSGEGHGGNNVPITVPMLLLLPHSSLLLLFCSVQNMRYRPRGEGHGGPGGNKAPIGAHAGEVKGGAIDWGYLATRPDAFGSKGYDLLNDPPPEPVQQGGCETLIRSQ